MKGRAKMNKTEERAEALLQFLQRHAEDRGVMADLRCGFSQTREHRAWPHIAAWCELDKDWSRMPVQTLCAAFATQPKTISSGNLGSTMRALAVGQEKDTENALKSFEGRFRRLLTCDTRQELCRLLTAVVRAAKAKEVAINYSQLYCDICWWENGDVKLRWAAAYWGMRGGEE
jgi:CRISPR type I-E-associated protein CasB/Cse2